MVANGFGVRALAIGLCYYLGAYWGVTQTVTPEGIAILWPPNAVLLAGFLMLPLAQWPWIAVAALVAECVADTPAFPLWSAMAFGLINVSETALAAWLIRGSSGRRFDFDRLAHGVRFLLYGPVLAAALAGMAGAGVYLLLERAETGYLALWRLWWFGDALGLLLLTPIIVIFWRWLENGLPRPAWRSLVDIGLPLAMLIALGLLIFPQQQVGFHLTPTALLPLAAWLAVRHGLPGAALAVLAIAVMAVAFLVRGMHPYIDVAPQVAVWLMQGYLVVVALLSLGLAVMLREIKTTDAELREAKIALQDQNRELDGRVRERTAELQSMNSVLEQANRQLKLLASTDPLTGIANRRHFYEKAERELARAAGDSVSVSLVMFDLDHFKRINDLGGHEAGDKVLAAVADAVQSVLRPLDLFGRVGGEEFLVFLPGSDLANAADVAERMRCRVENMQPMHDAGQVPVTLSAGVAQWNGADGLDELVSKADAALYLAKNAGRNRVARAAGD